MEFLALLLPILIDYINRKVADSDLRLWVSVGVCAVVGIGINFLQTSFAYATPLLAFEGITSSIMVIFGIAQLSFHALWSKTNQHEEMRAESKGVEPKDPPPPSNI